MVESTTDRGNDLFDSSVKHHLFKVGSYGFKLFWVAGKFFIMKHTVPVYVWHHFLMDLGMEAANNLTGMTLHTCAFAALLAKNMVFKLVLLGGKLFTVCSDAAFAKMSEKARLQAMSESSVVEQLNQSFMYEETLVDGSWLKESIIEEEKKDLTDKEVTWQ
jgi:hypothetical protein